MKRTEITQIILPVSQTEGRKEGRKDRTIMSDQKLILLWKNLDLNQTSESVFTVYNIFIN